MISFVKGEPLGGKGLKIIFGIYTRCKSMNVSKVHNTLLENIHLHAHSLVCKRMEIKMNM